MIEIKPFPSKHKCDAKRCLNLETYMVIQEGEHAATAQFYCKEHLKEIATATIKYFEIDVSSLCDPNNQTEKLQDEIEELKKQLKASSAEPIQAESQDTEIKAQLESLRATNEALKESNNNLRIENEKLKKAAVKKKKGK